jgi:glycosyltransferase involved in cell wall biosynthesis
MTLQWLISTYGNGIRNVENILLFPEFGLSYLVSHQDPENLCPELPEFLERRDVAVHRIASTGLSKNRNNALKMADADIVVLADDDIRLHPAYPHHVRAAFKKFPDADVICFQIRTPEGSPPYKNYPELPGYLTKFSQLKAVSSIEIAFRRKKILENKLTFDERFGLGTQADSGEEFLFLANCLRKGLKILFFPSYIVEHDFGSSVKDRPYYEDRRLFSTGAQNYVLYRDFAYVRNLLALVRRWPSLKKAGISASHFLKMKNAGCRYIRLRDRSASFSD